MRIIPIGIDDLEFPGPFSTFTNAVEEGLDIAAQEIKEKLLEPTQSWSSKPEFKIDKTPLVREIYTSDRNYIFANSGTRARDIFPHNPGGRLRIQPRTPKTIPFNFTGQSGGDNGNIFYAKKVHIKGVAPRGWDELVEYIYGDFQGGGRLAVILQNAIDRLLS